MAAGCLVWVWGSEVEPQLHKAEGNSRVRYRQTLEVHLHLDDAFISPLRVANRRESSGWPGALQAYGRVRPGPPRSAALGPALLQPRPPAMGCGLARSWVRLARHPHPDSSEDETTAHLPNHIHQEESVVGSLAQLLHGPCTPLGASVGRQEKQLPLKAHPTCSISTEG